MQGYIFFMKSNHCFSLSDHWPACEPSADTHTSPSATVFHSLIFMDHILYFLTQIQYFKATTWKAAKCGASAVCTLWWTREWEERRQKDFAWKAREILLKATLVYAAHLPRAASITCHPVTNNPNNLHPACVPVEGITGHPTVPLMRLMPSLQCPCPHALARSKGPKFRGDPRSGLWLLGGFLETKAVCLRFWDQSAAMRCLFCMLMWGLLGLESNVTCGNWCSLTFLVRPWVRRPGRACHVLGQSCDKESPGY